ncbi:MAG: RHS repeat-associated core domain-containing protein [Acidobacteriota bacterium]
MNVTYGYQAAAGQMGAGSTAGNAGQLISISGTMDSTTESASYTYDLLSRLRTSNQTSNGSSAQRRFAYDRWGNRTGMWDSVSGGNQIQSMLLQQSGGAPTNRLTSVTTSGVTATYSYDSAGNVTNDGSHTYTYDAENRIATVDGGTTATCAYDTSNQRYKKVTGGATTHYIWQGSQVIAEHNGGTGAVVTDYVYSGSRMIANVSGGSTQYFLSDRLSQRMSLSSSGSVLGRQSHLPFGEDFAESGTQEKHHFTGYERDSESGSDYAVNRQYAQGVGRFSRPDPFRGSSGVGNPQSLNRYVYVENDPMNATDPLGLCLCVKVPAGESTRVECFLCNDPPPRQRTRDQAEPGHAGHQQTAAECRKDMQSLSNALALAEAIVGAIFISAIQFGGGDEATELSQRFQDALAQHPPGSINAGNRESILQEFGNLGEQVPSLFGSEPEARKEAKRTRRAASEGRDLTSSLKTEAQALKDRCAGVLGLNDVERGMLSSLAARAQYDDSTFGSFYRGVILGTQ